LRREVRLTSAANRDLARLVDFLADKSPKAALRAADVLDAAITSLDEFSERGRPGPDAGLRELIVPFGVGAYVIRYRVDPKTVLIARISMAARTADGKALADPVRRGLLDALHGRGGQTLAELCEGRGMTRQAVSKHLAVLGGANLVATERRGRGKLHYLNPVPIHEIADRWIGKYERAPLADLQRRLEGETDA
jgi:DNA-binding transcriptional ArsR family regulator/plasmid stabilization system protein ParE